MSFMICSGCFIQVWNRMWLSIIISLMNLHIYSAHSIKFLFLTVPKRKFAVIWSSASAPHSNCVSVHAFISRLKALSWVTWRKSQRWRTQCTSSHCCTMCAPSWLRSFQTALTSTLRSELSPAWLRFTFFKRKKSFCSSKRNCPFKRFCSLWWVLFVIHLSGWLWSASRQSGPDGAEVQSIMGSPQGHCKTWDEAGVETKNVRLPQRLCRENNYSEDCTSTNNQQVCSDVDQMFQWNLQLFLVLVSFLVACQNFAWFFSIHPQVSCLSVVRGPSDICRTWGQHSSL